MRKFGLGVISLALVLLALTGCSKNNPTAPNTAVPASGVVRFALDVSGNPADNIVSGRLTITKGTLTQTQAVSLANHTGTVTFPNLQVGNWNITAQLFDKDGVEIFTGTGTALVTINQTTTVSITVNHNTGTLVINVLVPIVLTPTPTVTPGSTTLTIAYSDTTANQICLINSDGTNLRQISPVLTRGRGPANNYRGGQTLVYTGESPGNMTSYFCNLTGGGFRKMELTMSDGCLVGQGNARWAWNGSRIAGTVLWNHVQICTCNADGSGVFVLPSTNGCTDYFDCWTPDGRIIYHNNTDTGYLQNVGYTANTVTYIINSDGTNRQVIPAPAESRINDCDATFTLLLEKNYGIALMQLDGTQYAQVSASGTEPTFSADGLKITYILNSNVYIMNRDGSNVFQVTNSSNMKTSPHFIY